MKGSSKSRFAAGLRVAAPLGAWVAVTASLVFWQATMFYAWLAIGLGVGLVAVLLGAVLAYRSTVKVNPRRWTALSHRIDYLSNELGPAPPSGSSEPKERKQARADLNEVSILKGDTGPQWVNGEGYVDLSRGVHTVEEDFLDWATVRDLFEVAQTDYFRLTGSEISDSNRTQLLEKLAQPLQDLQSKANSATDADMLPSPATATAVKNIRHALNEYRDSSREGISRLVIHTMDAAALSGLLVYLLLVDVKVYQSVQTLAAGVAFFLVGALVGLLSALQALSQISSAVDDFGLGSARLITTPILSGLSGLAGALLYSLLAPAGTDRLGLGQI